MTTNAELEAIVKQMQKKLDDQEKELGDLRQSVAREEILERFDPGVYEPAPDGGGWLVRTPNKDFNGNTNGIRFIQGMAVVSKDAEASELKVRSFISEYGYSAVPIDEEEIASFNQHIANNLAKLMDGHDQTMEEKLTRVKPMMGINV